jgi:signal recognition particle subunit SEC65
MDMQKMQAKADLERMVYNYCLMDRIKSDEADQIISCLNRVIGYAPAPQAARRKIIPFPGVETGEQEHGEPAGEDPWDLSRKISEELGLQNIRYINNRIQDAIREAGIKSVEELARYPLEKLALCRGVGEKAINAIREALKAKGYEQPDVHEMLSGEETP